MTLSSPVRQNIYHFLEVQRRERYRTFVVHAPPLQGKTRFARQLSEHYPGAIYLDLLHEFTTHPHLATTVDSMDAQHVLNLVLFYARTSQAQLLLVDEFDFLIHIWADDLQPFIWMIEWLCCNYTPACIGFVLQTRPALYEWHLTNSQGQSRILTLDNLYALF